MELVIKIPEHLYEMYKGLMLSGDTGLNTTAKLIANGTPLPKGHGRLGDLDMLEKEIVNGIKAGLYEEGYEEYGHINDIDDCVECVKLADTIIEADRSDENDKRRIKRTL